MTGVSGQPRLHAFSPTKLLAVWNSKPNFACAAGPGPVSGWVGAAPVGAPRAARVPCSSASRSSAGSSGQPAGRRDPALALLDDVCQLVADQAQPALALGVERARREVDVAAARERGRADPGRLGESGCTRTSSNGDRNADSMPARTSAGIARAAIARATARLPPARWSASSRAGCVRRRRGGLIGRAPAHSPRMLELSADRPTLRPRTKALGAVFVLRSRARRRVEIGRISGARPLRQHADLCVYAGFRQRTSTPGHPPRFRLPARALAE